MNAVTSIVNKLTDRAESDANRKRDALADYPAIIQRAARDESEPGDAKRLAEIIDVLSLSAGDVREDLDCLRAIQQAEAACPADGELAEAQPVPGKLWEQVEAERRAWLKREQELQEQAREALAHYRDLEQRQAESRKRVAGLRSTHPRLFLDQPAPEPVQPDVPAPASMIDTHVKISTPSPQPIPNATEPNNGRPDGPRILRPGTFGPTPTLTQLTPERPGIGATVPVGVHA